MVELVVGRLWEPGGKKVLKRTNVNHITTLSDGSYITHRKFEAWTASIALEIAHIRSKETNFILVFELTRRRKITLMLCYIRMATKSSTVPCTHNLVFYNIFLTLNTIWKKHSVMLIFIFNKVLRFLENKHDWLQLAFMPDHPSKKKKRERDLRENRKLTMSFWGWECYNMETVKSH